MNPWLAKHIVYRSIQWLRGERVLSLYKQIHDLPHASAQQVRALQWEKLRRVLIHAEQNIPYYRELFERLRMKPAKMDLPGDLDRLPLLTKEILRTQEEKLSDKTHRGPVSRETTSGTLGNPLRLAIDRHKSASIRAVMFRNYSWYGINIGDKQARFWGVPAEPRLHRREQLKDVAANRIRLSAFEVSDDAFGRFSAQIRRFKPKYFYGYPSLLYRFAAWVKENQVRFEDAIPQVIITSGELLYDFQRETIRDAFHCRVVNEYGTTETGIIAFECPQGQLHINSDHLYVQSIQPQVPSAAGSLVVTELNNYYNPLIRYQLGDAANLSAEPCRCGLGFPTLESLAGREGNFIVTPKNRRVFSALLSYTFKEGIQQFQGIQFRRDELMVKIVKNEKWNDALSQQYQKQLHDVLGAEMKITFDFVARIDNDASGKLRYFISQLPS